eukprot:scaffold170_cov411-Prasinococcus_capsulatus_cf.AAC.5
MVHALASPDEKSCPLSDALAMHALGIVLTPLRVGTSGENQKPVARLVTPCACHTRPMHPLL